MTRADLDAVLDLPSIVSDNEGGLHDSRELDVAVPLMLPLELIQQSLVGGLGETEIKGQKSLIWRTIKTHCWCACLTLSSRTLQHKSNWKCWQIPDRMIHEEHNDFETFSITTSVTTTVLETWHVNTIRSVTSSDILFSDVTGWGLSFKADLGSDIPLVL